MFEFVVGDQPSIQVSKWEPAGRRDPIYRVRDDGVPTGGLGVEQ